MTVPNDQESPRINQYDEIDNPYPERGGELIGYLNELNFGGESSAGKTPLSYTEIVSWMKLTGVKLTSWEASALVNLSTEFVNMTRKAPDPNCPCPTEIETDEQRGDRIMKGIFR